MVSRGEICSKYHRYCANCGMKHHVQKIRRWEGNRCCPGHKFTRRRPP